MARKLKSGKWIVDFRPQGAGGPRLRSTFATKREAEAFEIEQKAKANAGLFSVQIKNKKTLSDLADDWYRLHGCTLKDGENRLLSLQATCKRFGSLRADLLTPEVWIEYRNKRLTDKTRVGTIVSKNYINHEQAYISAVFGKLIELKVWTLPNPLKGLKKLVIDEPEIIYLENSQIISLLQAASESKNPDLAIKIKLCLATGARWGEVEKLTALQVKHGKVHYIKTKNTNARAVPLAQYLIDEVLSGRSRSGLLFPTKAEDAFRLAAERANIYLPRGQKTHVLRHTFASHYMINDGNILKLQKILGHKTLEMTIRYAKLSPKHLVEALEKNPLANLRPHCVQQNEL